MPGHTPGTPEHGQKRLGELRGKAEPIMAAMEAKKAEFDKAKEMLASIQNMLATIKSAPKTKDTAKLEAEILEEKTDIQKRHDRARADYLDLTVQLEPLQKEINSLTKHMQAKTPVEFVDKGTGLVETKMLTLDDIRAIKPKRVDRKGKPVLVVEVDDLSALPPDLKKIVGAAEPKEQLTKEGTTMDDKAIIAKLLKIARNQQKIIEKLAQNQDPNQVTVDVGAQTPAPPVNPSPPPTPVTRKPVVHRSVAQIINDKLPKQLQFLNGGQPNPKSASPIKDIQVQERSRDDNVVTVVFKREGDKTNQVAYTAVGDAVQAALKANELTGTKYTYAYRF
jgi:hypothetical protein